MSAEGVDDVDDVDDDDEDDEVMIRLLSAYRPTCMMLCCLPLVPVG